VALADAWGSILFNSAATSGRQHRQPARNKAVLERQPKELAPLTIIFQSIARPIATKDREEAWPDLVLPTISP
jgi:hypothetical protein